MPRLVVERAQIEECRIGPGDCQSQVMKTQIELVHDNDTGLRIRSGARRCLRYCSLRTALTTRSAQILVTRGLGWTSSEKSLYLNGDIGHIDDI